MPQSAKGLHALKGVRKHTKDSVNKQTTRVPQTNLQFGHVQMCTKK